MFNLYVVLAGHDKVTDAGRANMCMLKVNGPSLPTKYRKWRTFRKHGFYWENSLKIADEKKNRNYTLDLLKNPLEHQDSEAFNWRSPLQTVKTS